MSSPAVPRLETSRLSLREWRATDLEAHAAMAADPEVMRFLGGTLDRAQSWRQMALDAGHWSLRGYGNWVVERTTGGAFLGRAGLWNPEGWPGLEVGWKLARHAWGHGDATEAARAAMDWAWTALDADRLISLIHPEKTPSAAGASGSASRSSPNERSTARPVSSSGLTRPSRLPALSRRFEVKR